jgi:hypothetical protein
LYYNLYCLNYCDWLEQGPQPKAPPLVPLEKPFRPTGPAKKGYNRTINKFPDYQEDPLEVRLKEEREEKKVSMLLPARYIIS